MLAAASPLGAGTQKPESSGHKMTGNDDDCGPSPCGTPVPFHVSSEIEVGTRVAAESITDWSQLAAAYSVIRTAAAPASLMDQQAIHAFFGGVSIDIHMTPSTFLWHRWFLYFHEQLLSHACGHPIVLPYWNGSLNQNLPVPKEILTNPAFAPVGTQSNQGSPGPASQANAVLNSLAQKTNLQAAFNAIRSWHDDVHACVAQLNPTNPTRGFQMTEPSTAAGDPLFYLFHSQFDRIFEWWRNLPNRKLNKEILEQTFVLRRFLDDGSSQCVCVVAGEALNLHYTYDHPEPKPSPGNFLRPTDPGGTPINTVEVLSIPVVPPNVSSFLVRLPGVEAPLGRLNLFGHMHGEWNGEATYPIPKGYPVKSNEALVLEPVGGRDRAPIPLQQPAGFRFSTARVKEAH
jgi:hypothetical protein